MGQCTGWGVGIPTVPVIKGERDREIVILKKKGGGQRIKQGFQKKEKERESKTHF